MAAGTPNVVASQPVNQVGFGFAPVGNVLTGTFGGTGTSLAVGAFFPLAGRAFNISMWGTFSATVQLERCLDGTNWIPVTSNGTQTEKFTGTTPIAESWTDYEVGAQYRLNCTAYTSGIVNYRLSQ
jgi:hypothetical protein